MASIAADGTPASTASVSRSKPLLWVNLRRSAAATTLPSTFNSRNGYGRQHGWSVRVTEIHPLDDHNSEKVLSSIMPQMATRRTVQLTMLGRARRRADNRID